MVLAEKHCVECRKGTAAMPLEQAQALLTNLPGWQMVDNGKWLTKNYKFKNFVDALAFTNKVGQVAEAEGHHPDLGLGWGYVDIRLQTHTVGGLHENDFILAAKIEKLQ